MAARRYTLDQLASLVNALRPTMTLRESVVSQLLDALALTPDEAERFYMLATNPYTSERVPSGEPTTQEERDL